MAKTEAPEVVFSAYFEGTANAVTRRMTQIGLFYELDRGLDVGLTSESAAEAAWRAKKKGPARFKMALNGCGYENGLAGVVFAYGMQAQCGAVASAVRIVRAVFGEPKMIFNVVGLSRGAVAALTIAAMLGDQPERFVGGVAPPEPSEEDGPRTASSSESRREPAYSAAEESRTDDLAGAWLRSKSMVDLLTSSSDALSGYATTLLQQRPRRPPSVPLLTEKKTPEMVRRSVSQGLVEEATARVTARRGIRLHLLLFDPVPGNQIATSQMLDPMGLTTANVAKDVRSCAGILRKVLAIYPYEPLPAITFHAPLVPTYPDGTDIEEIVSLGCHQGAILCAPNRISCRLSYVMIRAFLVDACRVKLRACRPFDECLATADSKLRILETLRLAAIDDAKKHGAQPHQIFIHRPAHALKPYVSIVRNTTGRYLNSYHYHLAQDHLRRHGPSPSSSSSSSSSSSNFPRHRSDDVDDDDDDQRDATSVNDDHMPLYLLEVRR